MTVGQVHLPLPPLKRPHRTPDHAGADDVPLRQLVTEHWRGMLADDRYSSFRKRWLSVDVKDILLLSFAVPLALISLSICLWRARQLGIAVLLSTFALILFLAFALSGSVNLLIDWARGQTTPPAKVTAYLQAIAQDDDERALALWPANERLGREYEVRRHSVTTELEELGPELSHRVLEIEWWSTCCEPHVITDSRMAGFARLWVEVSRGNEPRQYVFDVLGRGGSCWREMEGYPVRHWQIVDVYPTGEEPLYWRWPW